MHFSFGKRRFLRRSLTLLSLLMVIPSYMAFAQAPSESTEQLNVNDLITLSGGPLSLQQVALITLDNSPSLFQGQLGVESAIASARIATGAFDINTSVSSNVKNNRPTSSNDQDTQSLTFSLNERFRTGVSASASAGINRTDDRIKPQDTNNLSNLKLNITIPLLKGGGYVSAAAGENVALLKSQAAELGYYHSVSKLLLSSTNAYWNYKAAVESLKIQQDSEQRIQSWVDALKEGASSQGGTPDEANVSRVKGYLASKQKETTTAAQAVYSTKSALIVAMGISSEEVDNIGEPSEKFAVGWNETVAKLEQQSLQAKWIAEAKEKRLDIQAAKLTQESTAVNLAKTRHDVLPQLNLTLSASRSAIELGDGYSRYVDALNGDPRGNDVAATLTLSYPLGNNVAKGQRDVANVSNQLNIIKLNDLIRTIRVQVGVDANDLMRRLDETTATLEAVELYKSSLDGSYNSSRDNLLGDPLTIFSLMDLDEKLTEAKNDHLTSLQELAKATAQLRYQTGTILSSMSMDTKKLVLEDMSTIPGID
ncbi:MAG: hypothetical protein DRQ49_09630 [Gammaproteobacteria bacterium]|nr:MAG: hypothetical protein DRQ41_14175 [Gammaproteobacteria bacterium]RKZ40047.1 MAG: hypothetical protein DRQ49_09630 [Gammaproteobacteria bacterium]